MKLIDTAVKVTYCAEYKYLIVETAALVVSLLILSIKCIQ
jgi:hypothetical protein